MTTTEKWLFAFGFVAFLAFFGWLSWLVFTECRQSHSLLYCLF